MHVPTASVPQIEVIIMSGFGMNSKKAAPPQMILQRHSLADASLFYGDRTENLILYELCSSIY
jgi:hypothetical protein